MGPLVAYAVGCGPLGGCVQPPRPTPAPPEAAEDGNEARSTPIQVAPPPEAGGNGPQFSAEALAARAHAQRYVLGARGTPFGDYAPRPIEPVRPPAEASARGLMGSVDSDLSQLPGSRGGAAEVDEEGEAESEEGAGDELADEPLLADDGPVVDGDSLGIYVPLESPEALDPFYAALRRLARGEDPDKKVRVAVYGASHTAADVYTAYLRSYLQHRFGDGGLGYVSLARTNRWYRLFALEVESSKGWTTEHAQRSKARDDGYYGLLGASVYSDRTRDFGKVSPRSGRYTATEGQTIYDFLYLAQPSGGPFEVKIDDVVVATVDTRAKRYGPGYHTITRDGGPHVVEVSPTVRARKGKAKAKAKKARSAKTGEVRLFGMTVENDQTGVVVDTLGISGTRASNHLKWDADVWTDNLRRRSPDLYVLFYGTNEASDADVPISHYREGLTAVLQRFRETAPASSCLLMGPGDWGRKGEDEVYHSVQRTLEIAATQRAVAAELGCAYWDTLAFMGGFGSIETWASSDPPMAKSDHIHLTTRGYLRLGMAVTDAIMERYEATDATPTATSAPVGAAQPTPTATPEPAPPAATTPSG